MVRSYIHSFLASGTRSV